MRTGPRIFVACLLLSAALTAPAYAADTLSVFTDNAQIALGGVTTIAAHAETDAGFGGGHVAFKYKAASEDCQPSPGEDDGLDAGGSQPAPVDPGPSTADVGGQTVQLGIGSWRICGWLVDDATGAAVTSASTIVTVVPYMGSISASVKHIGDAFQIVLGYTTSGPARLFAALQKGPRACPTSASKISSKAVLVVPRAGRLVGSDGGLGRSIKVSQLAPGRWRLCSWLQADTGGVGPVTKSFAVKRPKPSAGHAAG